jgi:hypothetical protein
MKRNISKAFNDTILTLLGLGGVFFLIFYPKISIFGMMLILTPIIIYSYIMLGIDFQKRFRNTSNSEKRELLKENLYLRLFISGGMVIFLYWAIFSMLDGSISLAPIIDMRDDIISLFS